ncbi:polysaccharide deacetylase family protein [Benzoatithermus flavus]|uniref:Polysaccharide deacetylase family protein n=1 Tax=Benzoatithermus flavus TaxID=3108223 RepID=A0ABU8XSU1_9PROT
MSVPPEAALVAALGASPAPVVLWWRDDDAGRDHPRLASLLALAERRRAPVALAVVPEWLEEACAARILGCPLATVLQHGIAHADHAVPPGKKIELGGSADHAALARDLVRGRERLAAAFGARFRPVLVPPWNRIDPDLVPGLPALGFKALSTFGRRRAAEPVMGLRQVNTHLDLVAWREGGRALSPEEALSALAERVRAYDGEPIGILSHHLVMGDAALATLDRLLTLVQDHPKARLLGMGTLLGEARW